MRRWYVIQLKVGQEQLAVDNLRNQSFKCWYPVIVVDRMGRGKAVRIIEPLFAGYMFVRFDIVKDRWRSIANTKGVYKLLTATEDKCTALPKGFVEQLMKGADKHGVIHPIDAAEAVKDYVSGETVRVLEGSFKDIVGTIEQVRKNSVVILLSLLSGNMALSLPKIAVAPVPSHDVTVR